MKITMESKALKEAILWGSRGVNKALGVDATGSSATLVITNNSLTVKSYDGDKFFDYTVLATSEEEASEPITLRVPGQNLLSAAGVLGKETVTLEVLPTSIAFILPRSRFAIDRFVGRTANFPEAPGLAGTVNLTELKTAAIHAANNAFTGDVAVIAALKGVLFEFNVEERQMRLEASDRLRMVVRDLTYAPNTERVEEDFFVIVPADKLKLLLANLPNQSDVDVHAGEDFFGVSGTNFSGYVRTLDTQPVGYKALMQLPTTKRFSVDRVELKEALANISAMSTPGELVVLHAGENGMIVSNESETATVDVDITIGTLDGDHKIKFNPSILSSAVNAATTPTISVAFDHVAKPVVVKETLASGDDDPAYFTMVMPIR